MISMPMSRRRLMAAAGALGAQLAFAAPGARAQGRRPRLVVVILRGAADGLSMTPPLGDPNYLALRRTLALTDDARRLDADFALVTAELSQFIPALFAALGGEEQSI